MSGNMSTASADTSQPNDRNLSSSLLSRLICSSNRECRTTALAPASSIFRMLLTSLHSGEAETTSGFFSFSPRYLVERSIIGCSLSCCGCIIGDCLRYLLRTLGSRYRHVGPVFVHLEARVHVA